MGEFHVVARFGNPGWKKEFHGIMADFKTHITASTLLGIGYGAAGYYYLNIPPAHAMIGASMCSVAGMLPDLDSNSGIPQREMLSFVSVVVPMLMLQRFQAIHMTPEQMVFAAGVLYVLIRFGIGSLFKRFTKHRGMWHSIPAALVAGMVAFLVCLSPELEIRIFKSWAVVLGFITHLVLDEIYAVNWEGKLPRAKRSFGTALKFWGKDTLPNYATYAKLIILAVIIVSDDYMMGCLCDPDSTDPSSPQGRMYAWLFNHQHDTITR